MRRSSNLAEEAHDDKTRAFPDKNKRTGCAAHYLIGVIAER
jgi:hypothetical protein